MVEALYLMIGQDYKAFHAGHGHQKPFIKGYKNQGYAAQGYEVDETYEANEGDGYSDWAEDGPSTVMRALRWAMRTGMMLSPFMPMPPSTSTSMTRMPLRRRRQYVDVYDQAYAAYLDARKRFMICPFLEATCG